MSSGAGPDPASLPDPEEWNGYALVPCVAVILTIATIAVALRLWARAGILRVSGVEDWFIVASWACSVGVTACLGLQLRVGLGKHVVYVPPEDFTQYFKISIIQTIIYLLSLTFTKLSVLCLYIRVLTYDYVRVAAKTLLGIVLISHIYILATLCTACIPFDAFWDFSKRETAFCQPMSVYWSHAGLNIVTDFLIFMLPLTVMHKIRTPRPQKIALLAIFILAFSVCIISLTRAILLARDVNVPPEETDVTWDAAGTANWNVWEINIAIICACLTTMKPLVSRFFPGVLSPYPTTLPDEEDISAVRGPRNRRRNMETGLSTMDFGEPEISQPQTTAHVDYGKDGEAVSSHSMIELKAGGDKDS